MFIIIGVLVAIGLLLRVYQKSTNGVCSSRRRLEGKVALVTGGTAGMGLEIAKDFARRGAKVIVACPFENEGTKALETIISETANTKVVFKLLDLGSFASTRKFAEDIIKCEEKLDILVNNAGGRFMFKTEDDIGGTLQINFFGHFLLTLLLLPLLKKSEESRIVNVSSLLHWMGYLNPNNLTDVYEILQYGFSKLYVLHFSNELRRKLKDTNITVNCVDPGAVGTDIWNGIGSNIVGAAIKWFYATFYKTAKEGAQNAIFAAVDERATKYKGGYIKDCKFHYVHRSELDKKKSEIFWNECLKVVKFKSSATKFT